MTDILLMRNEGEGRQDGEDDALIDAPSYHAIFASNLPPGLDAFPQTLPADQWRLLEKEIVRLHRARGILQTAFTYRSRLEEKHTATAEGVRLRLEELQKTPQQPQQTIATGGVALSGGETATTVVPDGGREEATSSRKRMRDDEELTSAVAASPAAGGDLPAAAAASSTTAATVATDAPASSGPPPRRRRIQLGSALFSSLRSELQKATVEEDSRRQVQLDRERIAKEAQCRLLEADYAKVEAVRAQAAAQTQEVRAKLTALDERLLHILHIRDQLQDAETRYCAAYFLQLEEKPDGSCVRTARRDRTDVFASPHTNEEVTAVKRQVEAALQLYAAIRAAADQVVAELEEAAMLRAAKREAAEAEGVLSSSLLMLPSSSSSSSGPCDFAEDTAGLLSMPLASDHHSQGAVLTLEGEEGSRLDGTTTAVVSQEVLRAALQAAENDLIDFE